MEHLKYWFDIIMHLDKYLPIMVTEYKGWIYLILFAIIFCETGLVVTPFLPGDSLLFAAGLTAAGLSASGSEALNIYTLSGLLFIAAFIGDNSNYFIGNFIGHKVMNLRFVRKDYLMKTHNFYEKHGGKTVIIARFIPIIRTFAPFVAGIGSMRYARFLLFCILGNLLWINSFLWAGFLLGNNDFVKQHFTQVTFGIIIVSLLPVIYGALKKTSNPK